MAKKKGKGKGKKELKKGKLSHREREIYLLTIADLQHKIEWRKHLCDILKEDIQQYDRAIELEKRDKEESVALLEGAILEQREACQKAEWALPDAEHSKTQAEERRAQDLASKLVRANEEAVTYDAQLRLLRRKLKSLETYDSEKANEKIRDLEEQLRTEDEDAFLRGREQDRRRVEAFRREMLNILAEEAEVFQNEISGKLDKHFERITEETRWWSDTASGLRIATERLQSINDAESRDLRASRRNLRKRKEASVQDRQERKDQLQECQASAIVGDIPPRIQSSAVEDVESQREDRTEKLRLIERKEVEIRALEEGLRAETLFGRELSNFVGRAIELISLEAKHSLIVTYDGQPEEKKTLSELRSLFEEATRFIYENKEDLSVL